MTDSPSFDDVLKQALSGLDNDDVQTFYAYFDELKRQVHRRLSRKASAMPGSTAIAHSALLSMFCDLAVQQIPLSDVDEHGYPMLWPLLLKYVERHCDKWNKYYQAKKRAGTAVSLSAGGAAPDTSAAIDPADYRAPATDENDFDSVCEALYARLSPEERIVLEARLRDETLEQIAARLGRSESTVSNRLNRIRSLLEKR
jgi:RNA polymerase sigma factor (sigma-70 family)